MTLRFVSSVKTNETGRLFYTLLSGHTNMQINCKSIEMESIFVVQLVFFPQLMVHINKIAGYQRQYKMYKNRIVITFSFALVLPD